jgi:hypothetical protein
MNMMGAAMKVEAVMVAAIMSGMTPLAHIPDMNMMGAAMNVEAVMVAAIMSGITP